MRTRGARQPALPIDDSLLFKLVRVVNLTARPFVETIGRAHRLTLNEWRVLLVLASHDGSAARDVALHTGLDKMTVSRALASLARARRIVRAGDPADRRRTLLSLSATGRQLYERIGPGGMEREAQLFRGIGAAEQARLAKTLDVMLANLVAPGSS